MPFQSLAERERNRWRTLPEAVAHICDADGCDQDDARLQLRKALGDGALRPLRWEDLRPTPTAGGATVPLDIPPGRDPHWANVQIDWDAGTILDVWGEADPRQRVLLIRHLKLQEYWPKMQPLADRFVDPDGYEAQSYRRARGAREEHEAREAAWQAAWNRERSKPIGERAYFNAKEIADALAFDPRTLKKDMELWARIIEMISEWVMRRIFDLTAGEVALLLGDPPEFEPLSPLPPGEILAVTTWLMLRRDAAERFIQAHNEIPHAVSLLGQWFSSAAPFEEAGDTPGIRREIPYPVLRRYLEAIKSKRGAVPAQDQLVPKIAHQFPKYRVTRLAVRSVHEEVFGKLRPGKRSKATD